MPVLIAVVRVVAQVLAVEIVLPPAYFSGMFVSHFLMLALCLLECRKGTETNDVVQVCGCSVKCYVDVVSTNIKVLVVQGLVNVAHKLRRD